MRRTNYERELAKRALMKDFVSVIVPVYGVEKELPRCIESILNQTYPNFEVILVDDGSPDRCGEICDNYAKSDKRIKVIHKENGGQGSARNMALDICKGNYISFVDSDDYIKPNMLEMTLEAIRKTNADMVIFPLSVDNGVRIVENSSVENYTVWENNDLMYQYVATPNIGTGPCNKLYHRSLWEDIRFPQFRAHEDAFVLHRVLGKSKKAVFVTAGLYVQVIREGSTEQSSFSANNMNLLKAADDLMNYCKEYYPLLYPYVAYNKANDAVALMSKICSRFTYSKNKETYMKLRKILNDSCDTARQFSPESVPTKRTLFALNHPVLFRWKATYYGIERNVKGMIKRGIKRARNQKK